MKLADLMHNPLSEMLDKCDIVDMELTSNDKGEVQKIIIEYQPTDIKKEINVPHFNRR